ncbi:aldose 1-epimerase family protein [Gaetbulibacter sp. M240]|uniref:aldose 1-epimerase family protein n=1 Tax=Gaetbulibacter sp. M240 TaxID=3126511 RepID=UPI00374E762F
MKKNNLLCLLLLSLLFTNLLSNRAFAQQNSYSISNEKLTATILAKGAELTSLKSDSLEYIWQADPKYWNRHAPILFPIVGPLIDREYILKGKTYSMPQHGFVRDYDFRVIKKMHNSITFQQQGTTETKRMYPFDYILKVKYTLKGNTLQVNYEVTNPNSETMYFSLGAHPAFNCPFEAGQKRHDYKLVFDKKTKVKTKNKNEGFYIDDYSEVMNAPGELNISDTLFDNGSLTFNPNPFSTATIVYKPTNKKYLKVVFRNYPYLGIWSAGNSPFVCIEPWHGISDNYDHSKKLEQKEGIIQLESSKVFSCSFSIKIL